VAFEFLSTFIPLSTGKKTLLVGKRQASGSAFAAIAQNTLSLLLRKRGLVLPNCMKIDRDALHKIAHLARLEVKPEEEEALLASMENVLTWMEQLNELDTTGVEPLTHVTPEVNTWRTDRAEDTLSREEGLKNAPSHDHTYIKVPKVIE
jgi:aspartyl-tRNA(Asn)/glutamyl-tRNA(Gln) amidotransferase subunit C